MREHEPIWEAKGACVSLRNLALKTHRMMLEIVLARAADLKSRQPQAPNKPADGSGTRDADPDEVERNAYIGFASGDGDEARPYFTGCNRQVRH